MVDIDLDSLEPHINGPFSPDIATPLSKMKDAAAQHGWPDAIRVLSLTHLSLAPHNLINWVRTLSGESDWELHQFIL